MADTKLNVTAINQIFLMRFTENLNKNIAVRFMDNSFIPFDQYGFSYAVCSRGGICTRTIFGYNNQNEIMNLDPYMYRFDVMYKLKGRGQKRFYHSGVDICTKTEEIKIDEIEKLAIKLASHINKISNKRLKQSKTRTANAR